jgi:hypothetical protein
MNYPAAFICFAVTAAVIAFSIWMVIRPDQKP